MTIGSPTSLESCQSGTDRTGRARSRCTTVGSRIPTRGGGE
jgi:hypothetical protein